MKIIDIVSLVTAIMALLFGIVSFRMGIRFYLREHKIRELEKQK